MFRIQTFVETEISSNNPINEDHIEFALLLEKYHPLGTKSNNDGLKLLIDFSITSFASCGISKYDFIVKIAKFIKNSPVTVNQKQISDSR